MRVLLTLVAAVVVAASVPLAAMPTSPGPQPVVVRGGEGGFHWGDAGIGAAAGFGAALVLVGGIALTGTTHRLRRMR